MTTAELAPHVSVVAARNVDPSDATNRRRCAVPLGLYSNHTAAPFVSFVVRMAQYVSDAGRQGEPVLAAVKVSVKRNFPVLNADGVQFPDVLFWGIVPSFSQSARVATRYRLRAMPMLR
jgi:hypothetical protein